MSIKLNHEYFIDNFKILNDYINEFTLLVKNKKIIKFIPYSAFSIHSNITSDLVYTTDEQNYLVFEDNSILVFNYNIFSMISISFTNYENLNAVEKKIIDTENSFDLDFYNQTIIDYELNHFKDEYIINPATDETRPNGGDYFKELIFHLSNNKKICICPEHIESDGYCSIWMENNNLKGIFNGDSHQPWWNQ